MSPSKFDQARKAGLIPAPKTFYGVTVYDRYDLDRLFDDLPNIDMVADNNNEWAVALRQNGVTAARWQPSSIARARKMSVQM